MLKRILGSGSALIAVIAGLTIASLATPNFAVEVGSLPRSAAQQVRAAALGLVCPGAASRTGGESGTRLGFVDQLGSAELNAQAAQSNDLQVTNVALAGPNDPAPLSAIPGLPARVVRPTLLSAADSSGKLEQGSQLLSATTLQSVDEPAFSGLLGAACQQPSTDLWFVGGDTTVGREALLILTNPGRVDAQVDVSAWGVSGQLAAAGLSGLAVPAGKTLVTPLSAELLQQATFALQVSAVGGSVAGWIQQRVMRATLPGGSDFIAPSSELGKQLTIAGIMLRGSKDAAEIIKTRPAYADQVPILRVFVPKVTDAAGVARSVTVTAQIFGVSAKTFGTVIRESVTAGTVVDLPISGLADGDYVAFVTADQPVRAAVRLPRTNKSKSPATDFAWLQSGASLKGVRVIAVPASGITRLGLANSGTKPASISIGTKAQVIAGTAQVVTLAGGAAQSLNLPAGTSVWLQTESAQIRGNLVVDLDSAIATLPITDYKNLPANLLVSVR